MRQKPTVRAQTQIKLSEWLQSFGGGEGWADKVAHEALLFAESRTERRLSTILRGAGDVKDAPHTIKVPAQTLRKEAARHVDAYLTEFGITNPTQTADILLTWMEEGLRLIYPTRT